MADAKSKETAGAVEAGGVAGLGFVIDVPVLKNVERRTAVRHSTGKVRSCCASSVLGLCAAVACTCRQDAQRAETSPATSWFTEISRDVGLDFVHENGARGQLLLPEVMGGGVALFDFDGDGDLDIYFANGHRAFPDLNVGDGTRNRTVIRRRAAPTPAALTVRPCVC